MIMTKNKKKIIAFAGRQRSGKTQLAKLLKNEDDAVIVTIASALKNNSNPTKLQALNQFMVDNNIDLVNFESAVKVGLQGAIDLSDKTIEERKNNDNISTYEATLRILSMIG